MSNNSILTVDKILEFLLSNFSGLKVLNKYGEISCFYNPENKLKHGIYFLTIKESDGPNDKVSRLNRDDIFRISFGISQQTFKNLFLNIPKRPLKGQIIDMDYDFAKVDELMPHPIYAWMSWVMILNPTIETLNNITYLLKEGYELTVKKYNHRKVI
jgi:hypothetical protein